MRCCAAGEQLAGADAAGQGLGHRNIGHTLAARHVLTLPHMGLKQPGPRRVGEKVKQGAPQARVKGHTPCTSSDVRRAAEVALLNNSISRRVYAALWLPPELLPEGDLCLHPWEKETT